MLHGLTIVWAILVSRLAMPRKNNNFCSRVCPCQTTRVVASMQNPLFSCVGLQMVMMFLHASFAGNKMISSNADVGAKQIMNTYLKDTLRHLRSDQIGRWSVGTCAQADVTGRKGGDGFLRGVHACDGFLHLLFFLQENPR